MYPMHTCIRCKSIFDKRADVAVAYTYKGKHSYYCRPCKRGSLAKYINSPKGKAYLIRQREAKRKKDIYSLSAAKRAWATIAIAVYQGRITRPTICEHGCSGAKIEAHHH